MSETEARLAAVRSGVRALTAEMLRMAAVSEARSLYRALSMLHVQRGGVLDDCGYTVDLPEVLRLAHLDAVQRRMDQVLIDPAMTYEEECANALCEMSIEDAGDCS